MERIKYFFSNITILNLSLMTLIIGMIHYSVLPFFSADIKYALPSQKKAIVTEVANNAECPPPSPADYMIIAEDNLFHPERRIPHEKKLEPELPKPDFVLYGTLVSDDLKVAYLGSQGTPHNPRERQKTGRDKKGGHSQRVYAKRGGHG